MRLRWTRYEPRAGMVATWLSRPRCNVFASLERLMTRANLLSQSQTTLRETPGSCGLASQRASACKHLAPFFLTLRAWPRLLVFGYHKRAQAFIQRSMSDR